MSSNYDNILLIEDNPGDARLIEVYLNEHAHVGDYEITNVKRLSEGLELLNQHPFNIILLDLSLPDSQGLSTFKKIHTNYPWIPVVVLTGLNDEDIGVNAVKMGAQDFLIKNQLNGTLLNRAIRYAIERKNEEHKLRESEQRFHSTFEYANVGMCLSDLNGKFIEVNRSLCELFGYTEDELLHKSCEEISYPEDLEVDFANRHRMLAGKINSFQMEKRYFHKSGNIIWALLNVSAVTDEKDEIKYFISQIQDITQRKRAEKELESRAKQQAVIAELGIYALEEKNLSTLINEVAKKITDTLHVGYSKVLELSENGKCLRLVDGVGWDPSILGKMKLGIGDASHSGYALLKQKPIIVKDYQKERRFENSVLINQYDLKSGIAVIIQGSQKPYGILGVHTCKYRKFSKDDINFVQACANLLGGAIERKKTEDHLAANEQRYRTLFHGATDEVWLYHVKDDGEPTNFIEINNATCELLGYTREELLNMSIYDIIDLDTIDLTQTIKELFTNKEIRRDSFHITKSGNKIPVEFTSHLFRLNGQDTVLTISRNITDRRWLEQEILSISEKERQRIGQDLHDGLGQMLTGIGLITKNLARKLEANKMPVAEEVKEIGNLIQEADEQARGLARGLMPVNLEANGLSTALQQLVTKAERIFNITCTFKNVGTTLVHNNTLAMHLYRIAQEAISNAVKHGKANNVTVFLTSNEKYVRLRIQDNGVGFPEETEISQGMGVRIMHYRANMIGGNLNIRKNHLGGTIITCTIPVSDIMQESKTF
ncbi:MAG TPA: PAS domain S-box protein [Balneolales bacterium]|nr:PAS domain S-box protein [Balneolales bacterium]